MSYSTSENTTTNSLALERLKAELAETKKLLKLERKKNHNDSTKSIYRHILQAQKEIVFFALDHEFNYLSFNQAHADIMKMFWNTDISIGSNMLSVVSIEAEREKAKHLFSRALNGESFTIVENYSGDSEKPLYWELAHTPVKDDNNNIIGMSVILNNKTEVIENQKKFEKTQLELEKELKTKHKLFSIISHDLKNTVYGSVLLSKLLLENELSNEEKTTYNQQLYKSSKSTFCLLENLLTWSNSQLGSIKITPQSLNLLKLIKGAINPNLTLATEKNLNISIDINTGDMIFADKDTIERVINNLFGNAIKFTSKNGYIKITANKEGNFCKINFIDSGVGIAKSRIKTIFKIGENCTTVGTNQEIGTGLGLLLCKELVEKNGGTIAVSSKLNEGSTFSFTLPITK